MMLLKPVLIIAIIAVAMIGVMVSSVSESHGSFTPVLPVYIEDDVPTIAEFKKMNQNLLLKNYSPHSIVRENGEKIDLSKGTQKKIEEIFTWIINRLEIEEMNLDQGTQDSFSS